MHPPGKKLISVPSGYLFVFPNQEAFFLIDALFYCVLKSCPFYHTPAPTPLAVCLCLLTVTDEYSSLLDLFGINLKLQ